MATTRASIAGPVSGCSRRKRLVLTPKQKEVLQTSFQQNPYPGISTRTQLAQEIGIPESRIQVWFQNQRTRHLKQSRSASVGFLKEGRFQPEEQCQPRDPTCPPREARRKRTRISPSQYCMLIAAFEQNQFPGISTREELARQTGIPECRIQIWFQNRRARCPRQNRSRPANALTGDSDAQPHLPPSLLPSNVPASLSSPHPFTLCKPPENIRSSGAAPPSLLHPSNASVPRGPSEGLWEQSLQHAATQNWRGIQGEANIHNSCTVGGVCSTGLALTGLPSSAHSPLGPPNPNRSQHHIKQPGMAALPLKVGGMQWCDNGPQVTMTSTEAQERATLSSAHTGTLSADWVRVFDELLSSPQLLGQVELCLNDNLQGDEPPGLPESPLTEEEFQALLDML